MEFAQLPLSTDISSTAAAASIDLQKSGLLYISRIPPKMTPSILRQLLQPYGSIGRIYLVPKDIKSKNQIKGKKREFGQLGFEEGWVEFIDKRDAKTVAELLNTQNIGISKGKPYYDDLWTLKYLPKFKWHHLTDQMAHEKATKEQRLRVEISQVKKVNAFYLKQADKAHEIEVIQEKKRQKLALPTKENYTLEEMRDKLKIKQRKPVIKGELYSN